MRRNESGAVRRERQAISAGRACLGCQPRLRAIGQAVHHDLAGRSDRGVAVVVGQRDGSDDASPDRHGRQFLQQRSIHRPQLDHARTLRDEQRVAVAREGEGIDPEAGHDSPDQRAARRPDADRRILAGRREEPAIPRVLQRADLRGVATLDDQLDRARRRSGLRLAGRGLSRHGGAASHEDTGEDDAEQASGDHSSAPPRHRLRVGHVIMVDD